MVLLLLLLFKAKTKGPRKVSAKDTGEADIWIERVSKGKREKKVENYPSC